MILVTGYPAKGTVVPIVNKKTLEEIVTYV
jgi:hypothetical protein